MVKESDQATCVVTSRVGSCRSLCRNDRTGKEPLLFAAFLILPDIHTFRKGAANDPEIAAELQMPLCV